MRAIMVMFDSLNRRMLQPYGCSESITPNFIRLAQHSCRFDNCYAGSLPCMPARRELHTGRHNFLHRSWGPLEPFDFSMPEELKKNGVYSHLVSDHTHYWEDGGATYHTRYSSWENFRGQEGDRWKGVVGGVEDTDPNLISFQGYRGQLYRQDLINRTYMKEEKNHPEVLTFDAGLEFMDRNKDQDRWFLQIETFDPHEPFFTYPRYKKLYPHEYHGKRFDWPDYAMVSESREEIDEARYSYKALLSMCDRQLGRILDFMDTHDMWKNTMLIVNTDHGYLLGEHHCWAKNYMPPYQEIVHLPLFIWDPRTGKKGETRKSLVQTIDLPATILAFFKIQKPDSMEGKDLFPVLQSDQQVRDTALFGIFGGQVCITDGTYVYMRAPCNGNRPLYEYTLMPTHMAGFFTQKELQTAVLTDGFTFNNHLPVLKIKAETDLPANHCGNLLFNLDTDDHELLPLEDTDIENDMVRLLIKEMKADESPEEQYERLGLRKDF